MATTIVTKSGSGAPTASDLVAGELAVDLTNKRLYTEDSGGTVLELGLNPNGNVNVTGSVTADGLSVIGDTGFNTGSPDAYAHIVPTDGELNDQFVGLRVSRSLSLKSAQYGTINQSGGALTLNSTVTTGSASGSVRLLSSADGSTTKTLANFHNNNDISFYEDTGTTPKFFWDASAESLGIGTSSPSSYYPGATNLVIAGSGDSGLTVASGTSSMARLLFADGTSGDDRYRGSIAYSHASNFMSFATDATESMRIDSSQNLLVGKSAANTSVAGVEARADGLLVATRSGSQPLLLDRLTDDGILALFRKDSTTVGDISVSSGVVSYNAFMGSHYSETVDTDLLFGTVMEVTGELVDQNFTAQERLSKVKVSDTAESANVYGVWIGGYDGGGETVAALGASWCRIASGVTLELGDLLVSNGDGTAKVQSDDIIRSMTIGKVTSVTVKETHTDGSFVVPVVLYCG